MTDSSNDEPQPTHVPVMLPRVLALLAPALTGRPATVVDATLGLGGHTEALLSDHPQLMVVGLDRDGEALERSRRRLARYADRLRLVHAVYDEMPQVLGDLGLDQVEGVLFDLGVSSLQLDEQRRGFAYAQDAELDMRMDTRQPLTAAVVVNEYEPAELRRILYEFGEERFASRIVASIVKERATERLNSTAQLAELVRDAIPAATRRTGGHPAKRTFQALRIEVNGELRSLTAALPAATDALALGGRLVVMSYQSLEDRLVKRSMAAGAASRTPIDLPIELPEHGPRLRLLTRGAERPDSDELGVNPRSASVRLRAVEKVAS